MLRLSFHQVQLLWRCWCWCYSEDTPTNPTSPYGESKLIWKRWWNGDICLGFRFVSIRYFNVAGAHSSGEIGEAHNPETHLIPIVLRTIKKKESCVNFWWWLTDFWWTLRLYSYWRFNWCALKSGWLFNEWLRVIIL